MPRLHIFTLSWEALPLLQQLKESLLPTLKGINYSWHIKDNGSTDGTALVLDEWSKSNNSIFAHAYPDNKQTFSEGMNWLYQKAKPKSEDYILLLNNDVIFNDTTSIHNMIDTLNDDVGCVGARLLFTRTNQLQHAGVVFHPQSRTPYHFRSGDDSDAASKQNRYFQAVTGAVFLTKAKYYAGACQTNKSGNNGLDENLKWAFDDIDLSLSIAKNFNKKIIYCGKTDIYHAESVSLKKNPLNKLFLKSNLNYFLSKWHNKYVADAYHYLQDKNYNLVK